ncbi:thyrotropin-releasing hormone receptor-like [Mizuhopecten yessoensis]|uniref:Thyrotropin-releasing hormone receptor n=1 Tax=Mizuhopecten yessoensis TaxID=6573 RepID=A0A210PIV3_MIZYE|nr:thyrotropin-releasing hormone receptor-like [Mizuhopecten yessoensis]XP_021340699.1 thyrotropin-releasing hormone receptor-like [Mizuhopecten yessoensis]OWF36356.1 Thyrotropin-releasing hormone receptor [Mizuhopecten yessoensis]
MQDLSYNATVSNGSLDTNYDVQDEEENEALQTLVIYANRYLLPIIIVTGFLGNTISFFVFVCSRLKRISTSVYLAALSISDTGFLFCVGFGWLDAMGIHFFHTDGICQIVVYMTFVFSFTSVWYVNAFTIEMYVAVFHSSKGDKVCKPRFARRAVLVLTAFAALLYMFAFWTAKVTTSGTEQKCMSTSSDSDTMMVLSILDTFLTLLLPFSMIIFMTTRLLIDISRLYKKPSEYRTGSNNNSVSDSQGDSNESNTGHDRMAKQALKAQAKLKRMLVVVIIVFVVLNLPSHAIRVQFFFRSITESHYSVSRTEVYWQHIVQILYYINFAVNFVLYSACAKSFRHALLRLPLASCVGDCSCVRNPFNTLLNKKIRKSKLSDIKYRADRHEDNINSRLVEIHLSEIQISQLPSLDSEYVCQSPPCLLIREQAIQE